MGASAILKLQAAGFSTEQVTALAELIDSQAATKADLEAAKHDLGLRIDAVEHGLGSRIDAVKRDLGSRIDAVEHRLESKIDAVEHSLGSKIDAVDHKLDMKITRLEGDFALMRWMMGSVLAFEIALFYKLFLH
jgi:hypothetical protein